MDKPFEILRETRKSLLQLIDGLTTEQLNEIPRGFSNNIIWNIAHMIVAQQNVTYVRSGQKAIVEEAFFHAYKPDTKPEGTIDAEGIADIKELFLTTIDQFESDLKKNIFAGYTPWTNRYGVKIDTIGDVLRLLPFHDGLHFGYVMALKRIITTTH
jgi:hypothetical protein